MRTGTMFLAVALSSLLSFLAFAETFDASADIESKVKATGLKYSKTDKGGFIFLFGENAGRSQLVIMNGRSESYQGVQFFEIWSVAVRSTSRPVTVDQMKKLLNGSGRGNFELGHWCLIKPSGTGGKWTLYYSIHLPLSCSAAEMESALRHCSEMADETELNLVGTDDN